jgi:CrcB protein
VWRLIRRGNSLPIDPDLAADDSSQPAAEHRPSGPAADRRNPVTLASVAAGGFIGASARYEVGLMFPVAAASFPVTTFLINTSGAFALGVILALILERLPTSRHLRPFACVGVLGAWTTMSTLATESAVLIKGGFVPLALLYMAATAVGGVAATAVGIALSRPRQVVP